MKNYRNFIKKIKRKEIKNRSNWHGICGFTTIYINFKKNFKVYGFDQDKKKIKSLKLKKSYIKHISKGNLSKVIDNKNLLPTSDFKLLSKMNIIIVCVPTPLSRSKKPDLKYVNNAMKKIIKSIRKISPLIILNPLPILGPAMSY